MNSEQLNSARLARWSQNGEARLTLEAASEWLVAIGICSYLPVGPTGGAPSASFLEAVVGRPARIPSGGERARAHELLARMVENSAAVPLKLGPLSAEPPDSVVSPEVFRYIYALRGNRNFRAEPSTVGNEKVTPLALHSWQSIQERGPLDLPTLQSILGRDMTEAALAHALQELWAALYVCPIPNAKGQPAEWEVLSRRFPKEVAAGAGTGHAEALSAVVSLYLYAVVAATEDEILAYLSPLAPQSKLREVIRGLGSMRQLDMIDISGRAHLCLQGGLLPEMVAQLSEDQLTSATADSAPAQDGIEIESAPQRAFGTGSSKDAEGHGKFIPKKFVPRRPAARDTGGHEPAQKRFNMHASGKRPDFGGKARSARFRPGGGDSRRSESAHPAARDARVQSNTKNAERGPGERAQRWEKSGERPASRPSDRTFASKPSRQGSGSQPAGGKPWTQKGAGAKDGSAKPWSARKNFGVGVPSRGSGDREGRPRRWEKSGPSAGGKPSGGRPFRKPFGQKSGGGRPWASRGDAASGGERAREDRSMQWEKSGPSGEGKRPGAKPYGGKSFGAKPWTSRGAASRVGSTKSYADRKGDPSSGARPWSKRTAKATGDEERPTRREPSQGRSGDKAQDRSGGKAQGARPSGKSGAKPFWAKNPRGGKGSAAASRTNRPRGGKAGGKKSGKKK